MFRSHTSKDLNDRLAGERVTLAGWAHKVRDLGSIIFIDLRDRYGITQLLFDETASLAKSVRLEWVIQISGTVRLREEKNINSDRITGRIEIVVDSLTILNQSEPPVFSISEDSTPEDVTRLKYRYLDLRKPQNADRIKLRHEMTKTIRNYLNHHEFLDIETPILTKSTPEGARDYLVPSRVQQNHFYALPQSPQLFKQLLMMSGFEKYYQIVKCFRDEDLRAERQPEFTQVDIEASFVSQQDLMQLVNGLIQSVFNTIGYSDPLDFPILPYQTAMETYGTDAPDTRFDLHLKPVTPLFKDCAFDVFQKIVKQSGLIKGICVPDGVNQLSRKKIDELTDYVKTFGANGLLWIHFKEETIHSPIAKFLDPAIISQLKSRFEAKTGDTVLLIASVDHSLVNLALNKLRLKLAQLTQVSKKPYSLVWVTDFPLFEKNKETNQLTSCHHPFTAPRSEDIHLLDSDPFSVKAQAYDIVLNGVELGGGSIRIYSPEIQHKIFERLGLSQAEIQEKFGFFIHALNFGTPPHGGIALGLDRFVMMLAGTDSIRDVIAFPKTQNATCPLTGAPNTVSELQLKELSLACIKKHYEQTTP